MPLSFFFSTFGTSLFIVVGCKEQRVMWRAWCLWVGILLSSVVGAVGQDSVSRSGRITVSGERYCLHVVAKDETLYAISRKYNVSQTAIAAANPDIYYGIKEGQMLKIPLAGEEAQKQEDVTGVRLHIVKAGESLYSLSREFGVPVAELRKFNSLLSDTLQVHTILRIPPSVSERQVTLYEVQKGEGVYGISKRFGVSQEQLLEANPWLRERALGVGDKLVIPQSQSSSKNESEEVEIHTAPTPVVRCDSTNAFPRGKRLEVALLLPFDLGKSTTSESEEESYDVAATSSRGIGANTRYLDFYQGLLLALNEFRLKGCNIRLSVFDTQRSTAVLQKIIQSDTLRNANLIIGPVDPKNISLLSQYAAQNRIPIVSPLSGKTPASDLNPFLFQANPSFYTQLKSLVQESIEPGTQKVIVLREESLADAEMADHLVTLLREQVAKLTPAPTIEVLKYPKGGATLKLTPRLRSLIEGAKNTKIFIPSHSEPFVSDLLGQLNAISLLKEADSIDIYGMARWFKMRNLDLSQLGAVRVTLFSPFYIDYQSELVREFLESYRDVFRVEPSQYAFQGYDVLKYFLHAIYRYGEDFRYCLPYCDVPLLQTRFDFRAAQEFSSYESKAIYLLQFDLERGLMLK